jgi:hypothetical protein
MPPALVDHYIKQALKFGPRPGRHVAQGWARCPLCEQSVYGNAHPSERGDVERAVRRALGDHLTSECRGDR